ncbi:hypothetical protein E4O00_07155 [Treponema sp. OMZ 788]|uniref:hypothetical protein n=1 Tax=Treponema sp. OMZ 788 TaxID=2563664 RepID=UPI0020A3FC73|nr:hypothetical protein [Treponema sp. OMZ 788]UTC63726.1 hypothetical protein E4O00_07155 [Treponema sp. OMZ 788]
MKKSIFLFFIFINLVLMTSYSQDISPEVIPELPAQYEPKEKKNGFFEKGRTAFAFGINIGASASNSYFTIKDFLFNPKGTVDADFDKMSKRLPSSGFAVSSLANFKIYFDIYIKSKAEFGFFTTADAYAFGNMPKSIINLLAKGNTDDKVLSGKLTATGSAFAGTGLFYGMKIKDFKFRLSAAYFIPAFYIPYDELTYTMINGADGKINVAASGTLSVYTPFFFMFGGTGNFDIASIFKKGGADLSLSGSYSFKPLADLNFSLTNIPILPAVMDKGVTVKLDAGYKIESLFSYLNSIIEGKPAPEIEQKPNPFVFDTEGKLLKERKIFRPLKLNISSDIFPFSNRYLIISPNIGFHMMKPFYVDAGVKIETNFLKVFGVYYSLALEDRVWKNRGGAFIDLRLFRLETSISSASPSFLGSFTGSGLEVGLGLVFGY